MMENLRTEQSQLSDEQRAALEQLKELRALTQDQRKLLDKTFRRRAMQRTG